ncbi:MAG: hypothetical protein KGN36_15765 [Acidobacteriota bacterium]|nr:hypothetical protein [Acidobacteriota bacterium]
MQTGNRILSRALLPLVVAALPVVLLLSALRTFREVDTQRTVFLRYRVAMLAARLEYLPPGAPPEAIYDALGADDPYLVGVEIVARGAPNDRPALAPLWDGRELFRTELLSARRPEVLRAYIPFHSGGEPRIARIDLNTAAADFLTAHALHNVIVSSIGGVVLIALSILAIWAVRRASELRLRQMEVEHLAHIGKMAAVLAHEIRNPLGTIKGFAQLAIESGDARTRELLRPALAETERLEALVNGLLAYGRAPHPVPREVPWSEIAARLSAHARQIAGARPIRLAIAAEGPALRTDPDVLVQALLNLLRNAIEAIPAAADGEVRVDAAARANAIAIAVEDNGCGIPPDVRRRLFEPFHTTKAFGTGLGLATTKKLIASLGGDLELNPRAGGGTVALVRLRGAARAASPTLTTYGNPADR